MPKKYMPYLGLLGEVLCGVDTKKHTYSELDIEIRLNTGDVSMHPWSYRRADGSVTVVYQAEVAVMPDKIGYALDMLAEVMTKSKFGDKKRIGALLAEIKSASQRTIMSSGNVYASNRAISYFDDEGALHQAFSGLDYYFFIKDLYENLDAKADEIAESLEKVAAFVFDPAKLSISVGCDKAGYDALDSLLPSFKSELDKVAHVSLGEGERFVPEKKNEGIMIPSQVQYVARAGNFRTAGFEYSGAFEVVSKAVRADHLYKQIRVRGGAYGCYNRFSRYEGRLVLSSYRDPNLKKTDEVFMNTGEFVRTYKFDERELTKYIIGVFSAVDYPMSPKMKIGRSYKAYMTGDTYEAVNRRRIEMLNITEEEFRAVGEVYDAICKQGYFCVVGNEKAIRENREFFGEIVSI